jgi:hypothetical protein
VIGVIALTIATVPAIESGARASTGARLTTAVADIAAGLAARPLALIENRRVLSYPIDQVWPTAIRYLRIDRGFKITDRDRDAGYMLFEFPLEGARLGSGSVEMFATEDPSGRPSVSVAVNTGAGPVSMPSGVLDGIAAKVRAERGQPAPPPPPKQDEPPDQDEPDDDHSVPLMPPAEDP